MLYLIGLGLNENGISLEGLEAVKKCHKVYQEMYTVDYPYDNSLLLKITGKNSIMGLERGDVEQSGRLINAAKKEDVALLVYGAPLFATTHIALIMDCKKAGAEVKIIQASSVFEAVAETGLELYKFGKITSMPKWLPEKNFNPMSFMDVVKENQSIKAHSLILCDIGLSFDEAINELKTAAEEKKIKLSKIIVCSQLGTENALIFYDKIESLKKSAKKIKNPFCIIIPSELHFLEKEALEKL